MERPLKQFEKDRRAAAKIAARLLLASATTTPRVGGVGECTIHIIDDQCEIEDLCQAVEDMAGDNKSWHFFKRDAMMLRDADALLLITSLRSKNDPADINCNMCGQLTCDNLRKVEGLPHEKSIAFPGPLCIFRANNIALRCRWNYFTGQKLRNRLRRLLVGRSSSHEDEAAAPGNRPGPGGSYFHYRKEPVQGHP